MITTADLLGKWTSDPSDKQGCDEYGDVSLEFRLNGDLIYTIHSETKTEIMLLLYRLTDGLIITSQLSDPKEEVSEITIDTLGVLTIKFDGISSRYIRAE